MIDNSFKELTFNNPKKKCIEINGHYEEKIYDEMNTINYRAFIQTESKKKCVLNSKFEEKDKEACNEMDKDNYVDLNEINSCKEKACIDILPSKCADYTG